MKLTPLNTSKAVADEIIRALPKDYQPAGLSLIELYKKLVLAENEGKNEQIS